MAAVKTLNGEKLLIKISDGGGTPVYAHDCLINTTRGIAFSSETREFIVPDCTTPEDPAWKTITKDGLSATISGAGMLHTASVSDWNDWFASDDSKVIRIELGSVVLADGGGYWSGSFKLTQFEVTGDRKDKTTASVTLVSDGAVTWTDASA